MDDEKIRTESQLTDWVNNMKRRERRRNYVVWGQWVRNLAAFHGRPDIIADTESFRLLQRASPKALRDMEEVTVNLVQPHARMLAAKIRKSRPTLNALPATPDESDIQAAKVGDRLLNSEWHQQEMDLRCLEMAQWLASTGNAYWHIFFDSCAGDQLEDGTCIGQIKTVSENNFKVVLEPKRGNAANCRWAIISQQQPIDLLQAQYGELYKKRTGEELILSQTTETDSLSETSGISAAYLEMLGIGDSAENEDKEFTSVDILYHLPTQRYPGGMYSIVAGGKVLHIGKFPYPFLNRLPILHFREILAPWRMLADSSASQVLEVQDHYNTLRNLEKQHLIGNIATKILRPIGTNIDKKRLRSRDSEIVDFDPGRKGAAPVVIPGRNVPGTIYQSLSLCLDEAGRMGGLNDASMGIAQSAAASGRAVLALQEMDETKIGPTIQLLETEYTNWGKITLQMAKQFYDEPRKYAISGDSLAGGVFFFEKADLRSTNDVRCQPNSSMPQNKYAKYETVQQWYQMGLLGQPGSPEAVTLFRRMADVGTEDLTDDDAMDEQVAEKENIVMTTNGITMPVGVFDNDLVHLKVHARRYKAPGVRDNPQLEQIIAAHMQQHVMKMNPQAAPQPPQPPGPANQQPVATPPPPQNEQPPAPAPQSIGSADTNPPEEGPQ